MISGTHLRILLVDDHRVVRAGLIAILAEHEALEIVGEAGNVVDALELVRKTRPDIVLLDLRLPDGSGTNACREIKAVLPECKVVVLTSFAEEALVFEAIAAGVDGYLLKDSDDAALVSSLFTIASGKQVLSPVVTQMVLNRLPESAAALSRHPLRKLTARELCMVKLVSEGCTYKEVGHRLGIAEKTVRNSISLMLDKLGLASRSELVALYARTNAGILPEGIPVNSDGRIGRERK
jgi:two-component system, NarL family, response regulator DevR